MEINKLSPEKSFELITQVIDEARNKFEENGFIYMFWGALIAIASISQFILLKNEHYDINWYPYLLMPLGAIYSGIYFSKKKKNKKNQIGKIISALWLVLSINIMVLGFVFANILKENLVPVILILLSIGVIGAGTSVKSKLLIFSGIIINVAAFLCFKMDWIYHSLLMGIVAIVAFLIPGIILMLQYKKKRENV